MRNVLVTGAAGGIGTAATLRLAELGHTVYAGVRSAAPRLEGRQGVRVIRLDVTSPDSITSAIEEISAETDQLHALVNNAGVIVQGPLELVPPDEFRRQLDVNILGPALVTRACLPLLRAGGGRVINISAGSGRIPIPFLGALSASKAALESFSTALRAELAPFGIAVVVVEPGLMDTPIFTKADESATEAMADQPADRIALYASALAAMAKASAKMKPAPADEAAKAIATAVGARRPKHRYLAGRDARAMAVLSHLPTRTRDRLVVRSFGLKGA
jgi:NAD(P)-dependent dehydrogenase (short-subunit alcohol dehydrogenase family)